MLNTFSKFLYFRVFPGRAPGSKLNFSLGRKNPGSGRLARCRALVQTPLTSRYFWNLNHEDSDLSFICFKFNLLFFIFELLPQGSKAFLNRAILILSFQSFLGFLTLHLLRPKYVLHESLDHNLFPIDNRM